MALNRAGTMLFLKLLNFVLVFFPSIRLYRAHHDTIGAAVFVALFIALTWVDLQRLPFNATLTIKLAIFGVVEAAVVAGLYFYPVVG